MRGVAVIFLSTRPLLPMPVQTKRPLHDRMISTARSKLSSNCSISPRTAMASSSITQRATSRGERPPAAMGAALIRLPSGR